MDTKAIIDSHYQSNYKYYKGVCYNYCKGDDSHQELLHETYIAFLKIKPDVIVKFHELNRLYNLGLRIIRSLFQKRFDVKRHKDGNTSPMFNMAHSYLSITIDEVYCSPETIKEIEHEKPINYSELEFIKLENAISKLLADPKYSMAVTIFLQANETSINELYKGSGICRPYLTKQYNLAKNELKKHILQ